MENNYYVYIWYIKDSNFVFYVGKGCNKRASRKHTRNQTFMNFIDSYDCEYKIIEDNLSEEEAFEKEKYYISYYKKIDQATANITDGGPSGGDVTKNWSPERKDEFISLMTQINRERCSSDDFKEKARANMINRYKDETERIKQSIRVNDYWQQEENKIKHSKLLKEYYHQNPEIVENRSKKHCKPCVLYFQNNTLEFESRKALEEYLKDFMHITIARDKLTFMLKTKTPFDTPKKNKKHLVGFVVCYKDVETIPEGSSE